MTYNTKSFYLILFVCLVFSVVIATYLTNRISPNDNSGINGKILYGPTYPGPCGIGMDCGDKPYIGTVIVKTEDRSREITRFVTDSKGEFHVNLEPGNYVVEVPKLWITGCSKVVEVEQGKLTNIEILCDTGIR